MNIARQIRQVAQLSGTFVLRSGVESSTYFDKYLFESDPRLLHAICTQLATLLPTDTEIIAGLEMGGIPVVTALSHITGLPAAYVRKQPKTYGTAKYAEGPDLVDKNVVLVEDVVSSGGAIIDAVNMLNADNIYPSVAVCVIDRQSGGTQALRAVGVELRALLTMQDIENAPAA